VGVPATVKDELVAVVNPDDVADKVNDPCVPSVIEHPAKVATPDAAETGSVVHARVPEPDAIASVTDAVLVVSTSPDESSILATGWVVSAEPPVEFDGCVVRTILVAVPATAKLELVAVVNPDDVADKVNDPCVPRVMLHPVNVATPEMGRTGFVVQASVPVPDAIASVTDALLAVTTSPEESSMVPTGWVVSAEPPVDAVGCVVKMILVAVPATVKAELVAEVNPDDVADSLKEP
jgi:hypothetical protein